MTDSVDLSLGPCWVFFLCPKATCLVMLANFKLTVNKVSEALLRARELVGASTACLLGLCCPIVVAAFCSYVAFEYYPAL